MKSQETIVKVESIQTDEEALESHAKKRKKFVCKFCGKIFERFQALGGHMNKHPEDKLHEKAKSVAIFMNKLKMKSKQFKYMNLGEFLPLNNINQSKDAWSSIQQQPMESYQAWPVPPQLSWELGDQSPYDYVTNMPNQHVSYTDSHAPIDGKNELSFRDSSLDMLTPEEYNDPIDNYPPPYNYVDYPPPCDYVDYTPQSSRLYQDQQAILQSEYPLEQGNRFSTLNQNQSSIAGPLGLQMNYTSYPQYAQVLSTSEMGTKTIVSPQNTEDYDEFDVGSNHSESAFNRWNELPTDHTL